MPAKPRKIPAYRLHKPTGQAVVRFEGRDFYLGKHGTTESQEAYHRKVAEWITVGLVRPGVTQGGTWARSVNELILAFWNHAETYYRRADGKPTAEVENLRLALRPLKRLYGTTPAQEFGPMALKAVRQSMIEAGLSRTTVNQRTARIVRVFRFGVENELVPAAVHQALKAVPGLKAGRSGAKESRKVRPVPDEHVEAVKPHLSRQLWAVVELQRLTGMRSGEVLAMRGCDLDTSGEQWSYTPARHKTEHHGKQRWVPLGPKARSVVEPWVRPNPAEHLFQPREAQEEHLAERKRNRRTPLTPSQRARTRLANPRKVPGERYDTRAYSHAVGKACDRAGVPHWHPHRLRHTAATAFRKDFGIEIARVLLGHASSAVTEVYAEADRAAAIAAVALTG